MAKRKFYRFKVSPAWNMDDDFWDYDGSDPNDLPSEIIVKIPVKEAPDIDEWDEDMVGELLEIKIKEKYECDPGEFSYERV